MKFRITRIEYIKNEKKTVLKTDLETNDIELTRKELHQAVDADRILLNYCEKE